MNRSSVRIVKPMTPGERNLRIRIEKSKATELRLLKEMSRPKIIISKIPEDTKSTSYYLSVAKKRYETIQQSKSTRSITSKSPVPVSSRCKLKTLNKVNKTHNEYQNQDESIPTWLQSRPDFQETVKILKHQQEVRILQVLEINYHFRNTEDKKIITDYLHTITFFKPLGYEVICEVGNRLIKESYKEHEKIIRKGDMADGLILIYKGSANVVIDGVLVALKGPGDVVGDNALNYRMPRSADVIAISDCIIFKLLREDYEAAILNVKKQEKQEIFDFLQTILLFQGWSNLKLMRISAMMNVKKVKAEENLYKRNDPCTSLYFIKEGKVNVYTYVPIEQSNKWPVSINEWKIHQVNREYLVKIAKLTPGQYFGEYEILNHCNRVLKTVSTTDCVLLELNKSHVFEFFSENELNTLKSMTYVKIPDLKELQMNLLKDIDNRITSKKALMDALKINFSSLHGRDSLGDPKVKKIKNWLRGSKNRQSKSVKDLNNKIVFENSRNISVKKSRS